MGTPPPRTVIGTVSRLKRGGPKLSEEFYVTPLIKLDAGRYPAGSRPPARAATVRSGACVPAPPTISGGCRGDALDVGGLLGLLLGVLIDGVRGLDDPLEVRLVLRRDEDVRAFGCKGAHAPV
jgi:hypothetical protein